MENLIGIEMHQKHDHTWSIFSENFSLTILEMMNIDDIYNIFKQIWQLWYDCFYKYFYFLHN